MALPPFGSESFLDGPNVSALDTERAPFGRVDSGSSDHGQAACASAPDAWCSVRSSGHTGRFERQGCALSRLLKGIDAHYSPSSWLSLCVQPAL